MSQLDQKSQLESQGVFHAWKVWLISTKSVKKSLLFIHLSLKNIIEAVRRVWFSCRKMSKTFTGHMGNEWAQIVRHVRKKTNFHENEKAKTTQSSSGEKSPAENEAGQNIQTVFSQQAALLNVLAMASSVSAAKRELPAVPSVKQVWQDAVMAVAKFIVTAQKAKKPSAELQPDSPRSAHQAGHANDLRTTGKLGNSAAYDFVPARIGLTL